MSPASIWCSVKPFLFSPLSPGAPCGLVGPWKAMRSSTFWSPTVTCPRKDFCAHQAPHALLLTPQPRRLVWTVTSPVTTATASPSGGSVTAKRSVLTAPMSPRPLAVSPAPQAGGGGLALGFGFLMRSSCWEDGRPSEVICQAQPSTHFVLCPGGSWPTEGESSSWCLMTCFWAFVTAPLHGGPCSCGNSPFEPSAQK